jgi:hypothetical protein
MHLHCSSITENPRPLLQMLSEPSTRSLDVDSPGRLNSSVASDLQAGLLRMSPDNQNSSHSSPPKSSSEPSKVSAKDVLSAHLRDRAS